MLNFRLNCGGVAKQYNQWGSRCGLCGDDYGLPIPRPHELGGDFGQGIISRNYTENQVGFLIQLKKNKRIISDCFINRCRFVGFHKKNNNPKTVTY